MLQSTDSADNSNYHTRFTRTTTSSSAAQRTKNKTMDVKVPSLASSLTCTQAPPPLYHTTSNFLSFIHHIESILHFRHGLSLDTGGIITKINTTKNDLFSNHSCLTIQVSANRNLIHRLVITALLSTNKMHAEMKAGKERLV